MSGERGNGRTASIEPFGMQARDWYLPGREPGGGVLPKPFRRDAEQVEVDLGVAVDVPHDTCEVDEVRKP